MILDYAIAVASDLSVPVATVLLGSATFVLGQIIRKGVIDPYREVQRLRGEISSDIYFYNEYLANNGGGEEIKQEIKDTFRNHASELNSQMKMYSLIRLFTYSPTLPSFEEMEKARKSLTLLSNIAKFEEEAPFTTQVEEIRKNLKLD